MADLNCYCFTGRLTQDASVRTLATGKKVLTANVAVNSGFGEYKKTLYIKVQQWGERGDKIVDMLKKGQMITANGELSRSEWENKDHKTYVDFVVDVPNIQLIGGKPNTSNTVVAEVVDDVDTQGPVF